MVFCANQLKLDDKEINTSDFWKRQIIIASMHKRPASFGIYVSAKELSLKVAISEGYIISEFMACAISSQSSVNLSELCCVVHAFWSSL